MSLYWVHNLVLSNNSFLKEDLLNDLIELSKKNEMKLKSAFLNNQISLRLIEKAPVENEALLIVYQTYLKQNFPVLISNDDKNVFLTSSKVDLIDLDFNNDDLLLKNIDLKKSYITGASTCSALGFSILGGALGTVAWTITNSLKKMVGRTNSKSPKFGTFFSSFALFFFIDLIGLNLNPHLSNNDFQIKTDSVDQLKKFESKINMGTFISSSIENLNQKLKGKSTEGYNLADTFWISQNIISSIYGLSIIRKYYCLMPFVIALAYNHFDEIKESHEYKFIQSAGKTKSDTN